MHIFLIKATQLILALAFLIIIHEFGHFLFARMFEVKVDKFYIFFDPVSEIFKWRPGKYIGFFGSHRWLKGASEAEKKAYDKYKTDIRQLRENKRIEDRAVKQFRMKRLAEARSQGLLPYIKTIFHKFNADDLPEPLDFPEVNPVMTYEDNIKPDGKHRFWSNTEYGIGFIPLGGYCKIAGMIDESMDTEQMKRPAQKWEFRSKPAWQRLLIMIAGVLFNFLLAILIYAGIVYATGEKYVPFDRVTLGMAYSPEAHRIGFQDGDIPLLADGDTLSQMTDPIIAMMQANTVTVSRDGRLTDISIPEDFMFRLQEEYESHKEGIRFLTYRIPTRITQTVPGEGAARAGILKDDEVIAIDSITVPSLADFHKILESQAEAYKKATGKSRATLDFRIVRRHDVSTDTVSLPVTLSESDKMGVGLEVDVTKFYPAEVKHYSLFQALPRGVQIGVDRLSSYAKSMKQVASKDGMKSIGGFGSIGSIFPESWDWVAFWNIAAFLSVALAFMNIIPIPALDGGHVLFLLYEIIFRRPPSMKFMENAQICGMLFLILLLLYANGMDIVRLLIK